MGFLAVWDYLEKPETKGGNKEEENVVSSLFNNVLYFINSLKLPENNYPTTANFFLIKIGDTASFCYWKTEKEREEKVEIIIFPDQVFPEDFRLFYYPSDPLGERVRITIIRRFDTPTQEFDTLIIVRSFNNEGKVCLSTTREKFLLTEDKIKIDNL